MKATILLTRTAEVLTMSINGVQTDDIRNIHKDIDRFNRFNEQTCGFNEYICGLHEIIDELTDQVCDSPLDNASASITFEINC